MWSQSSHSDSESQPVRRWFQDTYTKEYLAHPTQPAFLRSTMSFHSPAKASARSLSRNSQESPRRRLHSLSPRYLSPIVSQAGGPFEEEFVMGCSVCGTKAIEDAAWTYHRSPPKIRPSHQPELASVDGENSGAYARILSWKANSGKTLPLSESISTHEVRLLEGKLPAQSSPFPCSDPPSSGALLQTTLVKEVFPTPSVPLTPLNYLESGLIKDSVFHNSLAERYVKDEERIRVAVRRAEYANRVKGFTRVVEAVKWRGTGELEEDKDVEAAQLAASSPLYSEEGPKEGSRPGARMKSGETGKRGRESDSRGSGRSSEEGGRTENLELARRKLEEIKQTVRQRREERKSKEATFSPTKPAQSSALPAEDRTQDSEEEQTPPHPVMTPAELPPSFEEGDSLQSFEVAPVEQLLQVTQTSSFPTVIEPAPHISESKRYFEEEKGTPMKADAVEVLGSGELDSASSEESEVREPRPFAGSITYPTTAQPAVFSSETSRKEAIEKREKDIKSPLRSGKETHSSGNPAFVSFKDHGSDKSLSSEGPEIFESEEYCQQGSTHSHQFEETSQSRCRELSVEETSHFAVGTGVLGPRKSDQTHIESESADLRRQSRPSHSPLSLPVQIARTSGEDTTERVEGDRRAGMSSSRLTAEATTERQRGQSAWEEENSLKGSYRGESTESVRVRVLPKQQERRKVAAVAPAKVSQVAAFHQLQWDSVLRIQRAYRRYVLRVRNNKACQTEGQDYARLQELLSLLSDPSILAGLKLLGGFVSYLQGHGLRSL